MVNFNIGDVVARKSYGFDILFKIVEIKEENTKQIALLKGISTRIEADAYLDDLKYMERSVIDKEIDEIEKRCEKNIATFKRGIAEKTKTRGFFQLRNRKVIKKTGTILHIDGDSEYGERSRRYYERLGLKAYVHPIPENRQSMYVYNLLSKYNPDILVLTGHDGMIKNHTNYTDLNNYKNSKYFIEAVKEARRYERSLDELVIFAGACQSFYEALMSAGCNFASAPERIFIDLLDPLVVAEKIATTNIDRLISMNEIAPQLKDGYKGVGGVKTRGKCRESTVSTYSFPNQM